MLFINSRIESKLLFELLPLQILLISSWWSSSLLLNCYYHQYLF